ncbi:IS1595 family transposase [Sphingomonas sp. BN140010]|uniref:IS1595 family transposase n=1 Tax=Sphingomonas arvum TaxID=2992113 RepID=A0ABT3JC08_9SPHN|nr:IS1595 family transposase [Sphingomonas sp. BN140010]MCW3796315.1 IS1595 family transposase [Sphingomonas sp. BN140010]
MDDILAPRFIDPVAARKHLEALRWGDTPECVHCGSADVTRLEGKKHRDGLLQCNKCREQFTVTVGTVFERSKIPLNKWLLANHLLCASKKGMSAAQIQRMLGVTYKTAWFMMHRIREAMTDHNPGPLGGPGKVVESDEAYIGGAKRKRLSGDVAPKKKVVTLVERDGRARSFHVANIHHGNVRAALVTNVDRASTLMTDEARFYWSIGKEFAGHGRVLHAGLQFAKKGGIHANTAENFFSILKRGVIGTYHHWSAAHLHRYLAEFDFRYSTKDISDRERADIALKGIAGKRLTYRRTSSLAA